MALSYFSTTRPGALSVAMNSSTTTVPLVSAATFPDPTGPGNGQYSIIVGYGSDREEVCTVTAKVGDTLTVIRGQDSTAATGKNQGDVVVHGVSARDFKSFALNTDPRLTDARTPTVHATSHGSGGADPVTPAAIGAPTIAEMTTLVNQAIPIGGIIMWSGTVAPNGWALCNGLNGTPDLQSRFIVGAGAGPGLSTYAVGAKSAGNTETVTLTIAQMPAHNHGAWTQSMNRNGSHGHSISSANPQYQGYTLPTGSFGTLGVNAPGPGSVDVTNTDHEHGIWGEGGGAAHNNLPPYYALAFIQRKT